MCDSSNNSQEDETRRSEEPPGRERVSRRSRVRARARTATIQWQGEEQNKRARVDGLWGDIHKRVRSTKLVVLAGGAPLAPTQAQAGTDWERHRSRPPGHPYLHSSTRRQTDCTRSEPLIGWRLVSPPSTPPTLRSSCMHAASRHPPCPPASSAFSSSPSSSFAPLSRVCQGVILSSCRGLSAEPGLAWPALPMLAHPEPASSRCPGLP